jgi:enamine deaminase RidA (YjgF/YER057c/UK114 family)
MRRHWPAPEATGSAEALGRALREFFSHEDLPASTWIGVSALAVPDFLIEIEAIAVLD